jgi:hypothetical protein
VYVAVLRPRQVAQTHRPVVELRTARCVVNICTDVEIIHSVILFFLLILRFSCEVQMSVVAAVTYLGPFMRDSELPTTRFCSATAGIILTIIWYAFLIGSFGSKVQV